MTFERIKKYNNILFYFAVLYTIIVMVKNYIDRARLPEGMCPIENNNHLMIIGIVLLVVSFIGNVIISYYEKKRKATEIDEK